jgi:hypothetical protein
VPFQTSGTADGWIVIACAKEKFWPRLAEAIGRPELGSDVRFENFAARRRNRGVLIPLLTEVFSSQTTGYWLPTIQAAGVPAGPINSLGQAIAEAQTLARQMIIEVDHPRWGKVRQTASPSVSVTKWSKGGRRFATSTQTRSLKASSATPQNRSQTLRGPAPLGRCDLVFRVARDGAALLLPRVGVLFHSAGAISGSPPVALLSISDCYPKHALRVRA